MQITIGMPTHGWLPFAFSGNGCSVEFRASNVLNDPLSELLYAAVWSLDLDYTFPSPVVGVNSPYTTRSRRAVHFWLEPDWHTLIVERCNSDLVELRFIERHTGGLYIESADLTTADITLTTIEPRFIFAESVYWAIANVLQNVRSEFESHWKHVIDYTVLNDLKHRIAYFE